MLTDQEHAEMMYGADLLAHLMPQFPGWDIDVNVDILSMGKSVRVFILNDRNTVATAWLTNAFMMTYEESINKLVLELTEKLREKADQII